MLKELNCLKCGKGLDMVEQPDSFGRTHRYLYCPHCNADFEVEDLYLDGQIDNYDASDVWEEWS